MYKNYFMPNHIELEPVADAGRAELLLHPLRQRILSEAREPTTAAEIARRVGLPAQKVNYHVRTLADAGFLKPAGEGRKRNLVEKRVQASAQSYVLLPQVLGAMSPQGMGEADRFSASALMMLSAVLQRELAVWLTQDEALAPSVPTLSLESELRFESAEQRGAFAAALQEAIGDVIAKHTSPARDTQGRPRPGRPFRLVLGCYPIPTGPQSGAPASPETEPRPA